MKGKEILIYLNQNSKILSKFGGIFSIDRINDVYPLKNHYYICNTDKFFNKGKHWIVIYWDSYSKSIDYFDSLGKYPLYDFIKFMNKSKSKITYNNRRIQDFNSDACGYFCLYFIFLRCNSISYNNIIDNFSNDLLKNEIYVKRFIKQTFKKDSDI